MQNYAQRNSTSHLRWTEERGLMSKCLKSVKTHQEDGLSDVEGEERAYWKDRCRGGTPRAAGLEVLKQDRVRGVDCHPLSQSRHLLIPLKSV